MLRSDYAPEAGVAQDSGNWVGVTLRAERQKAGETLEDAAAVLRIRIAFLQAIEQGRYDQLPGLPYAIGFVRTYAEHLGLDGGEMVRRFKAEAAGLERKTNLNFPSPAPEGRVPGTPALVISLVAGAVIFGGWWFFQGEIDRFAVRIPEVPERLAGPVTPIVPDLPRVATESAPPAVAVPAPPPVTAPTATPAPVTAPPTVAAAPATPPAGLAPTRPGAPAPVTVPASPPQVAAVPPQPAPLVTAAPAPSAAAPPPSPIRAAPLVANDAPLPPPPGDAARRITPAPLPPPAPPVERATPEDALAPPPVALAPSARPLVVQSEEASPASAPPPIPAPPQVAAQPDGQVFGAQNTDSRVVLRARGESWVQVRNSDNTTLLTRTLRPGDTYRVPNRNGLTMMTGNAGNLEILVDGSPAPAVGDVGAVKRNISLDAERLRAGTATSP